MLLKNAVSIKRDDVTIESIPQGYCHSVIRFLWEIGRARLQA